MADPAHFKRQRIRDPLHNLIEFEGNEFEDALWRVIQTRPFQRLRRIKQLGFSDFVYSGATHTRFAHSIGVYHIARHLMGIIERHLDARSHRPQLARTALAAALVHDVGHGPFSHAFEQVGKEFGLPMARHENVSAAIIRNSEVSEALARFCSGFHLDVAEVVSRDEPSTIYDAVISSQFDADRLDYMQRDRLMTGAHHGAVDLAWLVSNLEIAQVPHHVDEASVPFPETFVLGRKSLSAAEGFVLELFHLYRTVYLHKATRGAEKMFAAMLGSVIRCFRDGQPRWTGLPARHPLMMFAKEPDILDHVLNLDDAVITGALPMMAGARDRTISTFARRLQWRDLYKCLDVRQRVETALGSGPEEPEGRRAHAVRVDETCDAIQKSLKREISRRKDQPSRLLLDDANRVPYKRWQDSQSPLNQIMIAHPGAESGLIDLGRHSRAIAASEAHKINRAYFDGSDHNIQTRIERAINREVKKHG